MMRGVSGPGGRRRGGSGAQGKLRGLSSPWFSACAAPSLQAGVYTGGKVGVRGDAMKQRKEKGSLGVLEWCEDFRFQCIGLGLDRPEYLARVISEVDRVCATVDRVRAPGHQCALL